MTRLPLVALATAMLVASLAVSVACGGGGGTSEPVVGTEIDQDNLKFKPSNLENIAGTTITFRNSDTTIHTVNIDGKNVSGTMERKEVFEWTPPGPATYKISCEFHPQMKATITIK